MHYLGLQYKSIRKYFSISYMREQKKSQALILFVYNQTRETIVYDRAIFFFNKRGVLTDFAYSDETVPMD